MLLSLSAFFAATPAQCAIPALSLESGDAAFSRTFAEGSPSLALLKANVATAYQSACKKGLLTGIAHSNLLVLNAPNSNQASIYEGDDGRLSLEYHFVTDENPASVPSAEQLEEAIYCAVKGASPEEQETSGRCLPD